MSDQYRHQYDDKPNLDLSKGWAPGFAVCIDGRELLVNTVQATAATCKQRTEMLMQRDLPPNYTVVPIAIVFRKEPGQ